MLGTVLTLAYRTSVAPALGGLPGPAAEQARGSAEGARAAAAALGRPELITAADAAYVHAMHVTAGWATAVSLAGCAVVAPGLRRIGRRWS